MPLPPLPDGWSATERVLDTIEIAGLSIHRAGVASVAPTGEELTGAAADLDSPPEARAHFELLERIGTLEAIAEGRSLVVRDAAGAELGLLPAARVFPRSEDEARYREARSNGVAVHRSWEEATFRARAELVERNHVLRSWYGLEAPRRIDLPASSAWPVPRHLPDYEWRACVFEPREVEGWAAGVSVCGLFGLPRRDESPFLAGYGARATTELAILAAASELTQSLAFLWGEELPSTLPPPAPHAGAHLEWSLFPGNRARLAAWLDGEHRAHGPARTAIPRRQLETAVVYADLTPPWLANRARLVRAMHPHAMRLVFGESPDALHLPPALRIHPIG